MGYGDEIMATGEARELHLQNPDAQIVFKKDPAGWSRLQEPVWRYNPYITFNPNPNKRVIYVKNIKGNRPYLDHDKIKRENLSLKHQHYFDINFSPIKGDIFFNDKEQQQISQLREKYGDYIFLIGEIGVDPGSGWTVAGVSNAGKDNSLVRKNWVTSGNTTAQGSFGSNTSDSEWTVVSGQNTGWAQLGSHDGGSYNELITFTGTHLVANQTKAISIGSHGTNGKWNLVGNPFPSYLDLQHFYTDNSAQFDRFIQAQP